MQPLQCEVCGNKLIGKPNCVFECSFCGLEYSLAWAKQKHSELAHTPYAKDVFSMHKNPPSSQSDQLSALLKRGTTALEDEKWDEAYDYFSNVLAINTEIPQAHIGLCLVATRCHNEHEFEKLWPSSEIYKGHDFQRALSCSTGEYATWLKKLVDEYTVFFEKATDMRKMINRMSHSLSAGNGHTIGLKSNGTIVATGMQEHGVSVANYQHDKDVQRWTNLIAVAAGETYIAGLKNNGSVVVSGRYEDGQREAENWDNIIAISAGNANLIGLKADGSVVAAGHRGYYVDIFDEIKKWKNIVDISAGACIAGLRDDGTVVVISDDRDNPWQPLVSNWKYIVDVATGSSCIAALKVDGSVVAIDCDGAMREDVAAWTDIIAIDAARNDIFGLKANGTVVTTGPSDWSAQHMITEWKNIVAISAGDWHTVGLKTDGTVVAAGNNISGDCNINSWKLFHSIDTYEQEQQHAQNNFELVKHQIEYENLTKEERKLLAEQEKLQKDLLNLSGLFTKWRRAEKESRIADIRIRLREIRSRTKVLDALLH